MRFKSFFLGALLLLTTSELFGALAQNVEFFEDKPRSFAKDFYIFTYLQRPETTPEEAKELFFMVHNMNMRFFHLFAKKMDNEAYKKISRCIDLDINTLLKEDDECLNIGINLSKVTSLPKNQLSILEPRLSKSYGQLRNVIKLMQNKNVYDSALKADNETLMMLLQGSIASYKKQIFPNALPKEKLDALSSASRFNTFAINTIQNNDMVAFQKALIGLKPSSKVSSKALFFLGLNALKYKNQKQALYFLSLSEEQATKRDEKDKALFWKYLISKDAASLQKLSQSSDINMYSLYAIEKLKLPFSKHIVSPVLEGTHPTFTISDPFIWPKVMSRVYRMNRDEVESLANEYKYANTLAHYSYLMERATGYQKHYYPIPFPEELENNTIHRKALVLAIARQESRFLPTVVSTAYALGVMQFMPFLAKDIAKKEKIEEFDLDMMFDPKISYQFGNIHLDFLEKSLYHPLFVAYAYNGGIGFTKKHLQGGAFGVGKYEPFLSMEMMINEESREYGKKVLANYVVYRHLLNDDVSINNLFETLLKPSETDRFRNQ